MLHNGPGGAVHHLIVLGVLQQDPHDGGGGDIGEQPIRHRLIAGVSTRSRLKPGPSLL